MSSGKCQGPALAKDRPDINELFVSLRLLENVCCLLESMLED